MIIYELKLQYLLYKKLKHLSYPLDGCTIFVFDATLDDLELEALLLLVPLPYPEPTFLPNFLIEREAGVDFFLPTLGVGVGDLDPPREDAGVESRDPFLEQGVSERSLSDAFLFFLFLVANISLASSSSAAAASAA